MTTKTTDSQVTKAVDWIIDSSISGVTPLSSAESLAQEYLLDQSYPHHDDRVASLINWETTKNFTSGFITGLGGLLTLPISIPAAFGASWIIQARMAGAIARIHGHRLNSDRVRTLILASLLGEAGKEVLKQAGIKIAQKVGQNVIQRIPGKVLVEINKQVGFRLLTKAGESGVINLGKGIPFVGGPISGTLDAVACRIVGKTAQKLFKRS